jgi:hypothetical protein
MTDSPVDQLVADALDGKQLAESEAYREATFDAAQAAEAAGQVKARPDASSFHLLLALRREAPAAYAALPADVRASVLLDALRTQRYMNDWGMLGSDGYDEEAARALLETGDAARAGLESLLDDDRPARLSGSEEATLSKLYDYRRRDFAFRYLHELDDRPTPFTRDQAERARQIAEHAGPSRR